MRILIAEDDLTSRMMLTAVLQKQGHDAVATTTGAEALAALLSEGAPRLAILDWMMPELDGLEVVRRVRSQIKERPPYIIMLTTKCEKEDIVAGLEAGADDYLAKPFHMEELLARVRALIRRAQGLASPMLQCGALTLDTRSGRVTCDGQPVALTGHEFRLLAYLMHRPGAVVSRGELTEHLYAQDFDRDSNTIEVFVGRLRRKLPPGTIETVRGLGYRLAAPS
jgi:two-component system OmpR family response regulator